VESWNLIQAKSKFRMGASVGGFSVGIAAGCVARQFELLDGFLTVLAKGLKLWGLAPVEAVESILFKS